MEKTNITELSEFFSERSIQKNPKVITGVPSLMKGETIKQAISRRADNAKRIESKLLEKRAMKKHG